MKKKTKILIALVVIVAIAVAAYFLFSGKNSNAQLHNKVNDYVYGITDGDKNIVDEVDNTIEVMLDEINSKGLDLESEKANLELYLEIKEQYSIVQTQILNYGNFVTSANSSKFLNPMNKAYSMLVNIYEEGYDYLKGTYFADDFTSLSNATKTTYIENFNIKIKDIVKAYNDFMYNAGMVYTIGAKNLINYNNCYKLRLSYYVTLINNSVNLTPENMSLLETYKERISIYEDVLLTEDTVDEYVSNNKIYDKLVNNFKVLNIPEIVANNIAGTFDTYLESIKNAEDRQCVVDYATKIING